MSEATRILSAVDKGGCSAAEELLPAVYSELRRLAAYKLAQERPGQTLQATALVHEAWLRLVRDERRTWNDSHHFYCAAATAMRRILIENARRKNCSKNYGRLRRVNFEDVALAEELPSDELIAVDQALTQLAAEDAEAARLVELRFFLGFKHREAAQIMGIGRRVADGLWAYARAWLLAALQKELSANQPPKSP